MDKNVTLICLECLCSAETGGQCVQADHTRHTGGEDHGFTEIQDEHR